MAKRMVIGIIAQNPGDDEQITRAMQSLGLSPMEIQREENGDPRILPFVGDVDRCDLLTQFREILPSCSATHEGPEESDPNSFIC